MRKPYEDGDHVHPFTPYKGWTKPSYGNQQSPAYELEELNSWDGDFYKVKLEHWDLLKDSYEKNMIRVLPKKARIYFPKHVRFPRARFREWAKKEKHAITRSIEKADAMVVDSFFLFKMRCRYTYNKQIEKTSIWRVLRFGSQEFHVRGGLAKRRLEEYSNLVMDHQKWREVRNRSKWEVEGLDHLIECLIHHPNIPIISYDWLNNRVCNEDIDNMSEVIDLVKLAKASTGQSALPLSLNFVASLHSEKYDALLWVLNNIFNQLRQGNSIFSSTLYYSLFVRHMEKMSYQYLGQSPLRDNAVYWRTTPEDAEQDISATIRGLLRTLACRQSGQFKTPTLPRFVSEWFVRERLMDYLHPDNRNGNAFSDSYIVSNETVQNRIDRVAKHFYADNYAGRNIEYQVMLTTATEFLGFDFHRLLRYLVEKFDEQEKQIAGSQLGTEVCGEAETYLSKHRDQ